jgi:hypothetical protein
MEDQVMSNPTEKSSPGQQSTGIKSFLVIYLIAIVLALLAMFIYYLLRLTERDAPETVWTRAIFLFSGVEAVACVAGGFFVGYITQRQRAEAAEQRAELAEMRVNSAQLDAIKEATKGTVLAQAIRAKATALGVIGETPPAVTSDDPANPLPKTESYVQKEVSVRSVDLAELANLANYVYKDTAK